MNSHTLAATAASAAAAAIVGSLATGPADAWYRALRKPAFQPPPIAFPLVWTPLYVDIAVSSAVVLDALRASDRPAEADAYSRALALNLATNAGWTWLFFRAKRPLLASVECALLAGSSADLVRRAASADRRAAIALGPYAAWTAFATVLSGSIAWLNRHS